MAPVQIVPLPIAYRSLPPRLWPGIPPVFPDGEPTDADRELAGELFLALDAISRAWYRRGGSPLFIDAQPETGR